MGVIETKIMRVANNESTINTISTERGCFGWSVSNVQITHSENTKTYSSAWDQIGGNQTQTVETTTINYATLTLQRDKGLTNYAQIIILERDYEKLLSDLEDANEAKKRYDPYSCLSFIIWPLLIFKIIFFRRKWQQAIDKIHELNKKKKLLLEHSSSLLD